MSGKQNPCTICQETGGIAQETEDPTKLVASAPFKSLRPNIGHLPIFLRKHSLWVEPVDFPSLCMHQDARRQPSTFWSAVACSYRRWDRDWRGLDFHFFWSDYWCYRKLAKSAFLLLYLIYLRMFYLSYIPNHIIHTYIHTDVFTCRLIATLTKDRPGGRAGEFPRIPSAFFGFGKRGFRVLRLQVKILDLPLVSREWRNGVQLQLLLLAFFHSLLSKGRLMTRLYPLCSCTWGVIKIMGLSGICIIVYSL